MRDAEKVKSEMEKREEKILDIAFELFVKKGISVVKMEEVAKAAGIGRATLYRYYKDKNELATAVCARQWKMFLDKLDKRRPIESITDIPAIDRLSFTLDVFIWMYQNDKDLLQYNENYNYYITSVKGKVDVSNYEEAIYSANRRFELMYEKAKEDKSFRTDMSKEEFVRATAHTMLSTCTYYAGGFVWGAKEGKDYTEDLRRVKEMILQYVKNVEST